MKELILSVKTLNWRQNDANSAEADAEFYDVRETVLERDDRTCQFCGFKAPMWQEVHHLNDDHSDNRKENLTTICIYCHMCQHIGLAGRNSEAVLAWIPELSQAQLHHIVRTIQVAVRWADESVADRRARPEAIRSAKEMADGAKSLFSKLRARQDKAAEILGLSNPADSSLANIMLNMPDELYAKRKEFTYGIRLLPLGRRVIDGNDKMPDIVKSWMDPGGPYSNFRPLTWVGLLKSAI